MTIKSQDVLNIHVDVEPGRIVCWLAGELDALTAPKLRAVLAEHADQGRDAVLDLSALAFIDSSGLGVLVGALKRFQAASHHVTLRHPTLGLRRVLEITGLDRAFPVET